MPFTIETDFREVGGPGNQADGGQTYSIFSDADALAAMQASGYLDDIADTLNVRDTVILAGTDGGATMMVQSITSGVVVLSTIVSTGVAETLSGAGAIPITARSVDLTTGATDAMTIADGAVGQLLNLTHVSDGGSAVVTPANGLGYTTITMADAGDSVQLEFKSGGWAVIGQGGISTGPVVS
ncbi:MAG: hypothetical protein KAI73_11765 [Rhodospirillaceae bacterium]|nr:hypothetical protein [Rhodospirillaceae bacterium]